MVAEGTGDERIAYLSGAGLRVVGGDGRGDRLLARGVTLVAPAWRPRTHHVAYVDHAGKVTVRNADTGMVLWSAEAQERQPHSNGPGDGRYLLARGPSSLTVFGNACKATPRPVSLQGRSKRVARSLHARESRAPLRPAKRLP